MTTCTCAPLSSGQQVLTVLTTTLDIHVPRLEHFRKCETTLLTTHNNETTKNLRVEEGKEESMQKRDESRRKKRADSK